METDVDQVSANGFFIYRREWGNPILSKSSFFVVIFPRKNTLFCDSLRTLISFPNRGTFFGDSGILRIFLLQKEPERLKMGTFGKVCIFYFLMQVVLARGKTVNILTSGRLATIKEEEILRVFSQNKSEASSENYTFVELVSRLTNHTDHFQEEIWRTNTHEGYKTNPYYGEFNAYSGRR